MISYQRDLAANFKLALPGGSDADVKDVITYVEDVFLILTTILILIPTGLKKPSFQL